MKNQRNEVSLKVASYNIHKCRGMDGIIRPDRIINVIRELSADVVALQEVDHRFGRSGRLLDPSAIKYETGMQLLVQSDVSQRHGCHGNALLVRGDPISYRRLRLGFRGTSHAERLSRSWTSAKGGFVLLRLISDCFVIREWIKSALS